MTRIKGHVCNFTLCRLVYFFEQALTNHTMPPN